DTVRDDGLARARWFLSEYHALVRLEDPAADLQLIRRSDDDRHLVFRQRHAGIPVYPDQIVVHLDGGDVTGIAGRYAPEISLAPAPRLSAARAEEMALALAPPGAHVVGDTQLRWLDLGLLLGTPGVRLTWRVALQGGGPAQAFSVDADTGALLFRDTRRNDLD